MPYSPNSCTPLHLVGSSTQCSELGIFRQFETDPLDQLASRVDNRVIADGDVEFVDTAFSGCRSNVYGTNDGGRSRHSEVRQSENAYRQNFNITVGYDTDIDFARKLIKRIGSRTGGRSRFRHWVLDPIKMQGVQEFGEYGIVLRVKATTRPEAPSAETQILCAAAQSLQGAGHRTPISDRARQGLQKIRTRQRMRRWRSHPN